MGAFYDFESRAAKTAAPGRESLSRGRLVDGALGLTPKAALKQRLERLL